jgi:2-oxoacid:acceptor oxidoreductase gamma subunit (pyruvate/2-ketoisovalerate family)
LNEVRFHGRGGQGAVVASRVLAEAFFQEGKYVQSFPAFGAERRGAPVAAFTRADTSPIRRRTQIYAPDHVIVLDDTLLDSAGVMTGLKPMGWVVINTEDDPRDLPKMDNFRLATVDASLVAVRHGLGSEMSPIVNTAILGAFAQATGLVGIESVCEAIRVMVRHKAESNVAACREAYEVTRV